MNYIPKEIKQNNPTQIKKELTWAETKPQKETARLNLNHF